MPKTAVVLFLESLLDDALVDTHHIHALFDLLLVLGVAQDVG